MDRKDLVRGAPYRITGPSDLGGFTAEGEFVAEFGTVLIFRNLKKDPTVGFRTAWLVEWDELESVNRGEWVSKDEEDPQPYLPNPDAAPTHEPSM